MVIDVLYDDTWLDLRSSMVVFDVSLLSHFVRNLGKIRAQMYPVAADAHPRPMAAFSKDGL